MAAFDQRGQHVGSQTNVGSDEEFTEPERDLLGLVGKMRDDASGFTCRPCFLAGVPHQTNRDGSKMSEENRCAGCGELVCDRHSPIDSGDNGHAVRAHGAPMPR